jgi:hypothetical protein
VRAFSSSPALRCNGTTRRARPLANGDRRSRGSAGLRRCGGEKSRQTARLKQQTQHVLRSAAEDSVCGIGANVDVITVPAAAATCVATTAAAAAAGGGDGKHSENLARIVGYTLRCRRKRLFCVTQASGAARRRELPREARRLRRRAEHGAKARRRECAGAELEPGIVVLGIRSRGIILRPRPRPVHILGLARAAHANQRCE